MAGWDCEYSITKSDKYEYGTSIGLRIPIRVSPKQITTKTFRMTNDYTEEPNMELKVVEAYGVIEI